MSPQAPLVELLGADSSVERVNSAPSGEVAVVNAATVADLAVLGFRPDGGLCAARDFEPGEAGADHQRQVNALTGLVDAPDVSAILTAEDVHRAVEDDRTGVFLSCEGGDFLDGDPAGLEDAYAAGIRSVTLVHYRVNELGDIQTEDAVHSGLTSFGREVVREMNRLGMIVDLAHATFATTMETLEESAYPVMISHSHLASKGSSHPRLLSVEHAAAVADAGGLIGAWPAGIVAETLDDYCAEICRLVDTVGVGHVAIGTDLDANYRPVVTSYEQFPEIAAGLGRRGMGVDEIDGVLGGNFIDLLDTVVGG